MAVNDLSNPQLQLAYTDRHAGQDACLAAGETGYRNDRERVELAVSTLARSGTAFTADDVHRLVEHDDPMPYCRNLVSSVLGQWARNARILEDRSRQPVASASRSRRASRNRWWRGARATSQSATQEGGAA
jgi:hypothetical protein